MATNKTVLGGLGGIMPAILLLIQHQDLAQRIDNLLAAPTPGAILAPILYSVALFGVGALLVYVQKETDPWKAFQIGIAAPAACSMLLNSQLTPPDKADSTVEQESITSIHHEPRDTESRTGFLFSLFPSAYAQEQEPSVEVKKFTMPEESFFEQLVRGVKGTLPDRRFYVAHDSYSDLEDAVQARDSLYTVGLTPELFHSKSSEGSFRVVLGEHLSLEQAKNMSDKLQGEYGVANKIVEVAK